MAGLAEFRHRQHENFQEEQSGFQYDALEIKMRMMGNSRGHGGVAITKLH